MGFFRGIGRIFRRVGRGLRHGIKRIGHGVGRIVRAPIKFIGRTIPRAIKKIKLNKIGRFFSRSIFRPLGKAISWVGKTTMRVMDWFTGAAGSLVSNSFEAAGQFSLLIYGLIFYILYKVIFSRRSSPQPVILESPRVRYMR